MNLYHKNRVIISKLQNGPIATVSHLPTMRVKCPVIKTSKAFSHTFIIILYKTIHVYMKISCTYYLYLHSLITFPSFPTIVIHESLGQAYVKPEVHIIFHIPYITFYAYSLPMTFIASLT